MNIHCNQDVMIAIAWVVHDEEKYFTLFPEVIFVYSVADTNSDKRPLLILTGKHSKGKMFTILRSFLPNKSAWIFCLIFSRILSNSF